MSEHARNLDTYNDWQADDNGPDVSELLKIIDELSDVAQWYTSFYHDVQQTAPEYFERCGDFNATQYLYTEAITIRERAKALLNEWEGTPESEPTYEELPL